MNQPWYSVIGWNVKGNQSSNMQFIVFMGFLQWSWLECETLAFQHLNYEIHAIHIHKISRIYVSRKWCNICSKIIEQLSTWIPSFLGLHVYLLVLTQDPSLRYLVESSISYTYLMTDGKWNYQTFRLMVHLRPWRIKLHFGRSWSQLGAPIDPSENISDLGRNLRKSPSRMSNCYVFGIIGKLF